MKRRAFMIAATAALLSGCRSNRTFFVAEDVESSASMQSIFVATTRQPVPAPMFYGETRAHSLSFSRFSVSIPPSHVTGRIEWPRGSRADLNRHFALASVDTMADMESLVRAVQRASSRSRTEAMVFVHGFNTSFAKGVYRHAQIAWDYGLRGPQISFAWPSAGRAFGYSRDRDSVLLARDHLVLLLGALLESGEMRLSLAGHSMGCLLVMEALRQLKLTGRGDGFRHLAGVSLVAPDIDMDLFRAQVDALRPLPQPFVIAAARNDRFLQFSSLLTRGLPRLGTLHDPLALGDIDITVLDLTALGTRGSNHFLPGTSPAAIALFRGMNDADIASAHAMALRSGNIVRLPNLRRETIASEIRQGPMP